MTSPTPAHDPLILALQRTFPSASWPWALVAWRQEAVIWNALTGSDLGHAALQTLPADPRRWTPAALGLLAAAAGAPDTWAAFQALYPADPAADPAATLDDWPPLADSLQARATAALERWRSAAIIPPVPEDPAAADDPTPAAALAQAAWLALALRERYRQNRSWPETLAGLNRDHADLPVVLAVLCDLVPQSADLLAAVVESPDALGRAGLALHAFLCHPLPEDEQVPRLYEVLSKLSLTLRLDGLRALEALRPALAIRLAAMFLAEAGADGLADPLETAPVDLGRSFDRLADTLRQVQSFQLAGQTDRSVPLLAESLRTLRRLRGHLSAALAQTVTQAHGSGDESWRETAQETGLEAWKQSLQLAPDTPRYAAGLVNALLAAGRPADARTFLAHHLSDAEQDAALALAAVRVARVQGEATEVRRRLIQALRLVEAGQSLHEGEYILLAAGLLEQSMPAEVCAAAERGLKNYPLCRALWEQLAVAQLAVSRPADALHAVLTAQALGSTHVGGRRLEVLLLAALEATRAWSAALDLRLELLAAADRPTLDELHAALRCAENAARPEALEALCRRILELAPSDLAAHRALALAARVRGEHRLAAEHFAQVVRLAPDQPDGWLGLVEAYRQAGELVQALDALRAAAQALPEQVDIHVELGEAYLAQSQPTQALACFRRAARLSADPRLALRLGQTLLQVGRLEEAAQVLGPLAQDKPVAELDPDLAYAYARALLGLGKAAAAVPLLTAVVRRRPEAVEPALDLARALMRLSDQPAGSQRALPFLQRILDLNPDGTDSGYTGRLDAVPTLRGEARALLAEAYAAIGEASLAIDAFRRALDDPYNRRPAVQARLSAGLGRAALQLDQPEMAVAALQEAAQAEPLNVDLQRSLSEAYLASGLVQDAFQAASAALDLQPENTGVLDWFIEQAGRLVGKAGESGLLIRPHILRALEAAARLDPDRPTVLLKLGRTRLESGDRTGALDAFRRLAGAADRLPVASVTEAARAARELGDSRLAVRMLTETVERRQSSAAPTEMTTLWDELSLAQEAGGDLKSALHSAEKALALDEQEPRRHVRVANLLAAHNHLEPALERMRRAVELAPRDPHLRRRTAELLRVRGDLPAALEQTERGLDALEGAPASSENDGLRRALNLEAAALAHATLRPRRALAYLQSALPADDPARNEYAIAALRADLAFELNDREMADQAVEVMTRLDADAPRTLAGRSRRAGRRGNREERDRCCRSCVRAIIQEGLNQTPETPPAYREEYIASYLAVAQAAIEARLWDEAIATLDNLIKIIPETPLAYFKLAQIGVLRGEAQCLYADLDVIHHGTDASLLAGPARHAVDEQLAQAQALLGVNFHPELFENFKPWDDECRTLLGVWMARAKALFQPDLNAARLFETLLRMHTAGPEATAALVLAYRRSGETAAALQAVEVGWQPAFDAADSGQHPLVQVQLALTNPDPSQALAHASAALEAGLGQDDWPPLPLLEYLVARLAEQQGALPAAMQAIKGALTAWPDEPRWQELAARIYLQPAAGQGLPDPVQALVHLEAAAALDPQRPDNHLSIGRIYLSGGQIDRALPALEQASRLDPDRAAAWLALAQAQVAAGDLAAAALSAERAVVGYSGAPEGADRLAEVRDTLHASAAPASSDSSELTQALLLRGQIALQTNNPRGAASRAQQILRSDPKHAAALGLLARALEALDQPAEALAALERALPLSTDPLPLHLERARLLRRSQGLEHGIAALEELAEAGVSAVYALLAHWRSEAGRTEAAVAAARQALQDESDALTAADRAAMNLLIGLQMRRTGQLDQAILHLSEAINHAPDNLDAYLELGRAYQERREYRQALKVYQKAISVAPADYRAYYQAGLALKDSKDYLAAEAMLRRAAQVAPNEVSVHRLLGAVVALNLVHNRRMNPSQP